jgi:hypothetical protein
LGHSGETRDASSLTLTEELTNSIKQSALQKGKFIISFITAC